MSCSKESRRQSDSYDHYSSSPSFTYAFKEAVSTVFSKCKDFLFSAGAKARTLGISVKQTVVDYLETIFVFLSSYVSETYSSLVNLLKTILFNQIEVIVNKIQEIFIDSTASLNNIIIGCLSIFILILAVSLPKTSITITGRFVLGILSGLTFFMKSYLSAAVAAFFIAVLAKFAPYTTHTTTTNVNFTKGTLQHDPEEIKRDAKTFLVNLLSTGVLLSAATTGIDLPTDAVSWNKLLQRHALINRSYQFWEFGAGKISELFEESARIVCKYVYKTEYTSFTHIQEIDDLLQKVMDLCTLENQFRIGKDEELSTQIELMYIHYLQLCKIYAHDSHIKKKLDVISAPLTAYYRRVTNKNPRANAMRKEPVVIALTGGTGLGKTYLATAFQQDLLKICGKYRPDDCLSGQIYARCIEQEFWDGYTGQPIVVFDDFGQQVDTINNPNKENFELIRTGNIFPYMLHSAELAEKANNPFLADFIYLTTNLEEFKPKSIVSSEALNRRVHIKVEIKVKDEFLTDSKPHMLDVEKLLKYRLENNLDEADFSHLYFVGDNFTTYSYEELIVKISLQYKKNVDNFEGRKRMAFIKKEQKLPKGCYASDSQWLNTEGQLQGDLSVFECSSATFFNQEPAIQKIMLRKGYKIYNSRNVALKMCETIEDLEKEISLAAYHFEARSVRNCPQVDHKILAKYAFERYSKIPTGITLKTRYGDRFSEEIPTLTKEQFTILKKYEEELHDIHVNPDNANPFDWNPENEGIWRYLVRKWMCLIIKAYQWDNPLWLKFCKFIKFYVIVSGFITLLTAFYKIVTNKGEWSTEQAIKNPILTFFARRQQLSVILTGYCVYYNDLYSFARHYGIFSTVSEIAFLTTMMQYCAHKINHRVFNTNCSLCSKFKPLDEFPGECDEDVDVNASLQNIQELIEKKQADLESPSRESSRRNSFSYESPSRESSRRNSFSYESFKTKIEGKEKLESIPEVPKKIILESDPDVKKLFKGHVVESEPKLRLEGYLSTQCQDLMEKSINSMHKVSLKYDDIEEKPAGIMFCLKGRKCIMNFHYLENVSNHWDRCVDKSTFKVGFKQFGKEKCLWTSLDCLVQSNIIKRGGFNTEFIIFSLPKEFPNGTDMSKHLIKTEELTKLSYGVRVTLFKVTETEAGRTTLNTKEGIFTTLETIEVPSLIPNIESHVYPQSARYDISTTFGDCGYPVFLNNDMFQKKLLGFHFAGVSGGGACSIITFKDVEDYLTSELAAADPTLAKPQIGQEMLPESSARVVGYVDKPVTHPCATTLRKSLVYETLGPAEMAPAVLKPALIPDGPMLKGIMKYNLNQCIRIPLHLREKAIKDYFQTNIKPYPTLGYETKLLTFEQAVAGVEGNPYIVGLKRSKSAGYPYMLSARKGKTDWFGETEWDFSSHKCEDIRKDCQRLENECKHGIVPEVIFVATLKDEKRSLEKVEKGATRVFAASPLHFTIVFRKYFSGFLAFMMRNKIFNECCVGTNVHGPEWHIVYKKINKYKHLLAGDFSNFDGDLLVDIMYDILRIINDFYSDGNDLVRECLWECLVHSKQLLNFIVIEFFNGQPSGNPGTAIINSMYVSLLFRNVFYSFDFPFPFKFNQYCSLVTYGDDHVLSVRQIILDYVSPFKIKNKMAEFGHGYTDCFKNQINEDTEWSSVCEVSFLKRYFVPDSDYTFAPLELRSIREMTNWIKKCPSPLNATVENVENAMLELVHHEKSVFNDYSQRLCQKLSHLGVSVQKPHYDLERSRMKKGEFAELLTDGPWV